MVPSTVLPQIRDDGARPSSVKVTSDQSHDAYESAAEHGVVAPKVVTLSHGAAGATAARTRQMAWAASASDSAVAPQQRREGKQHAAHRAAQHAQAPPRARSQHATDSSS